jgi:type I restriction enzyme S subunit
MEEIELKNIEFYEETEFKETEIGLLPKHWQVVRLDEVFSIYAGGDVSNINYSKIKTNKFKYPIFSNSLINDGLYGFSDSYKFPENSITVTGRGNLGYAIPRYEKFNAIIRLLVLVPKENVNIKTISEYINFKIRVNFEGSSIPQLTIPKISFYKIPLPPLSEQQKIAAVLSAIQEAKEKTERVIEATKNLKKSLMKHLFTYGPVPLSDIDKVELKETEIGPLPTHWQVVRLGEVAEIKNGGPAPQEEKYFGGSNYFIRVQHIDNEINIIKTWDLITDEAVKQYKLKLFKKNTIVFPKTGATIYLEKRAKLPFDAYIVSHLCAINSIIDNLIQDYLFYVLINTKFSEKKGDGYPTLNISEIKQTNIPLPPLPEQQKIAEILSSVDEKIQKEEERKRALENLFKSMLHNLMTGKIRVRSLNSKG